MTFSAYLEHNHGAAVDTYAGWKESQKVFTDALADLITAGSSAYVVTQSNEHLQKAAAGSRRMLATPQQHHDTSYPAAQSASSTLQSTLNAAARRSTAGIAHGLRSPSSTYNTTEGQAEGAHIPSTTRVADAKDPATVNSQQIASHDDTCQADAVSTVCTDKDQPVLASQPWEQEEQGSVHGLKLQQCQLLNASVCEPSVQMSKEGKGFMVAMYNALAWDRASEPIRVPLDVTAGSAESWMVTGQVPMSPEQPQCNDSYKRCL